MKAQRILAVALGGALGTLARLGAEQAAAPWPFGQEFAILVVNLLGAFALGLASGHGLPRLSPAVREGITIGLLGSYTTMSAVAVTASTAAASVGVSYLVVTIILGVLLAWLGILVGQKAPGAKEDAVTR